MWVEALGDEYRVVAETALAVGLGRDGPVPAPLHDVLAGVVHKGGDADKIAAAVSSSCEVIQQQSGRCQRRPPEGVVARRVNARSTIQSIDTDA